MSELVNAKPANVLYEDEFWVIRNCGPRMWSAHRKSDGEHRLYWSFESLERDFGRIKLTGGDQLTADTTRRGRRERHGMEITKQVEAWREEAKQMTPDKLPDFLNRLCGFEHDYETIVHAVAAAAVAAAHAVDRSPYGGITGFQAGGVMWEFIRNWMGITTPARLVRYENMLYPQYERDFEKTITRETADWLKQEAAKKLAESDMHPDVRAHLERVAAGEIPFGYSVTQN